MLKTRRLMPTSHWNQTGSSLNGGDVPEVSFGLLDFHQARIMVQFFNGSLSLRLRAALLLFAVMTLVACAARAPLTGNAVVPARHFALGEVMIEQLRAGSRDDACDYAQVLPQLLKQAGPTADVYPSENYYYFSFSRAGSLFSGSIRLSSDRRDAGGIDYVCYESNRSWVPPGDEIRVYLQLSQADGVSVSRLSPRSYRVKFGDQATTFVLHQLDHTSPGTPLRSGETRVGRTLDDSGAAFELIFHAAINNFYFVLDPQSGAPDDFFTVSPNTDVSRRTGFVYYRSPGSGRRTLVAVNQSESILNSAFDGPFDHLPENDYVEIGFWNHVYRAYPELAGSHTPGGTVGDDGMIFSLAPYRLYHHIGNLGFIEACIKRFRTEDDRVACMIWGLDDDADSCHIACNEFRGCPRQSVQSGKRRRGIQATAGMKAARRE